MSRSVLGVCFALLTAAFSVGQAPPTPAPAPAAGDYFPLKKGAKWIYKLNENELTVEVTNVDKDKNESTLRTSGNGKEIATETIAVEKDGIYRTKIGTIPITPKVKILELRDGKPAPKGTKWKIDSKIQQQDITGEFEIKEDNASAKIGGVDVTNIVKVDGASLTVAGSAASVEYWFAPAKGTVKLIYTYNGQKNELELKSYEEPK